MSTVSSIIENDLAKPVRFLFVLFTLAVYASTIVVYRSLFSDWFYLWQWENLGLVTSVFMSALLALYYTERLLFKKLAVRSDTLRIIVSFFVVLINCFNFIVLYRTLGYIKDLKEQQYLMVPMGFMALHLAAVILLCIIYIVQNAPKATPQQS